MLGGFVRALLPLSHWRKRDGEVREVQVAAVKLYARPERFEFLEPFRVLRLKGKWIKKPKRSWEVHPAEAANYARFFELTAFPEYANDDLLDPIASELQKPFAIHDDKLGELVLDRELSWFEGRMNLNGRDVLVTVPSDGEQPLGNAIATGRRLKAELDRIVAQFKAFATDDLIEICNREWIDPSREPVSRDEFQRRLELESITSAPDGDIVVWFRDGGLFADHGISVEGNIESGPEWAGLHG